jgi:hypothetical protein
MTGYLLRLLILVPLTFLWKGFVISTLWGWFLVEHFALPALSIPIAIGMTVLATQLIPPRVRKADAEQDQVFIVIWGFVWPAFGLLYGWVTQMFI